MKKIDVLAHFGSVGAVSRALRISHAAISKWGDDVPDSSAYVVELVTNGALKTDETLRMEREHGSNR
jgi:hypothetical protein